MNSKSPDIKNSDQITRMFRFISVMLTPLVILFQTSCKKLIETDAPVTSINAANVYSTDASAISVVTGMYKRMTSQGEGFTGLGGISLFAGLSSDEFTLYNGVTDQAYISYYRNSLVASVSQNYGSEFWSPFYNYIFVCNAAIEGLNNSNSLTPSVRQQLLGESKFMRAFIYFYLTNMYNNVPLATSTDWNINLHLSNAAKNQIYQQIITDLKDAETLLSTNYLDGTLLNNTSDRLRPTKWAAAALLARAYLYYGNLTGDASNYMNAETQATSIINNASLYDTVSLNNVFLKNSKEAIWQLQPTVSGHNTEDGWTFIITPTGPNDINGQSTGQPVYLSPNLLNSFESGDQRKSNWVDSGTINGTTYSYAYKYKSATLDDPITEYLMVLRLGEQYLIRAEARAQQNNASGAVNDLNVIRDRAGLSNYLGATDKNSLLSTILHERQVELFSEWGHRWFDMKRTGTVDAIMGTPGNACSSKGGTWQSYQQLFPIPFSDIQSAPSLKQNPGF